MILSKPDLALESIGPELLELNRESLKLQLDISKIKPPTQEEEKAIENRVSERFAARLSNLSSPDNRQEFGGPPKSVNTRNPSGDKRLQQSEDTGKSTAISSQRPLRQNGVLSPNAANSPAIRT